MGSKLQRQNRHQRRLMAKIKRWNAKGKVTTKLEKELRYSTGEFERPAFRSGRASDPRNKRAKVETE